MAKIFAYAEIHKDALKGSERVYYVMRPDWRLALLLGFWQETFSDREQYEDRRTDYRHDRIKVETSRLPLCVKPENTLKNEDTGIVSKVRRIPMSSYDQ